MEKRNIIVTIDEAKELYNSGNACLRGLALRSFSKEELEEPDYRKILSLKDVYDTLGIDRNKLMALVKGFPYYTRIMAQYDIENIHRVMNGHWKPGIYSGVCHPMLMIHGKGMTPKSDIQDIVGHFVCDGKEYDIVGGRYKSGRLPYTGNWNIILGMECRNPDIARHISRHFYKYMMLAQFVGRLKHPIIYLV